MAEPVDMIMPMLREMRAENAALHAQTRDRFTIVEQRLDKLEASLKVRELEGQK